MKGSSFPYRDPIHIFILQLFETIATLYFFSQISLHVKLLQAVYLYFQDCALVSSILLNVYGIIHPM